MKPLNLVTLACIAAASFGLGMLTVTPDAHASGEVVMTKRGGSVWRVFKPDGAELSLAGSSCQGLDTAIAHATSAGFDLRIHGGGLVGSVDPSVIQCDAPLVFPPMQKLRMRTGAITLNFGSGVTGTAVTFNSCMMCDVEFAGQIVHNGPGAVLQFRPSSPLPLDPVTAIVDSRFRFGAVVGQGAARGDDGVRFDFDAGGIDNSTFEFTEVNGSNRWHGIRVPSATSHSFTGNTVTCPHVHSQHSLGVVIGTAATARIFGNRWSVNIHPASGGHGLQTHGSRDRIELAVHDGEGTVGTGFVLGPGATDNLIFLLRLAATLPIQDLSGNTNRIH